MVSTPQKINRIFLDTAPIIYFIERHPKYYLPLLYFFDRFDRFEYQAIISPITIAECLIIPMRARNHELVNIFNDLFENHPGITSVSISQREAQQAAQFRSQYNLSLLHAFQISIAIQNQCDIFLSNDKELNRIKDIKMLLVDDLSSLA